jgi:hypothetical protein
MRPRDLLGVAIRAFGLWNIYEGFYQGFLLFLRARAGAMQIMPWENQALTAFHFVLGIFVIVLADLLVRAVYGAAIEPGEG